MKMQSAYPVHSLLRSAGRLLLLAVILLGLGKLIAQQTGYDATKYRSMFSASRFRPSAQDSQGAAAGQRHGPDDRRYSIKPIAYVFPQFHPIPENDEFWGEGFTEWTNVRKVKENMFGQEVVQPAAEIGYYNLLDYDVRKRYAQLVRDTGLYGVAYHHYWFGYPVMDKPLQALLADGQPDVPFMLSWANEPWTVRWDGVARGDGGTLLDQDYTNTTEWRRHYEWMAAFFRHPLYVRAPATGNVQLAVYAPAQMGDTGKRMFARWRAWAAADPAVGGLDVIETAWVWDNPAERGHTDAMSEFAPHSGGALDLTIWERNPRLCAVHHRGVLVAWDNTPRHATDEGATVSTWAHPDVWKTALIGVMRRIKLDPNPRGQENFLFVNALNEWGEGNVLEPSVQWGDRWSRAFREALDYANAELPWIDELMEQGDRTAAAIERDDADDDAADAVDVCVIVRDPRGTYPWTDVWQLSHTLWSLQAQANPRWRAVVVPVGMDTPMRGIEAQVLDSWEPRVRVHDVPADQRTKTNSSDDVTDWAVRNMRRLSPACARATYLLVTNASVTYEPHAFDLAAAAAADIIGLNAVSPRVMALRDEQDGAKTLRWDERCARFAAKPMCQPMQARHHETMDLSAALINQARWRREGHLFRNAGLKHGDSVHKLEELQRRRKNPWAWVLPPNNDCHVIHPDTFPACVRTGRIWFDSPDQNGFRPGCYSGLGIQYAYGDEAITKNWDYERFKNEDPFCVRMSKERYEGVMAGDVMLNAAEWDKLEEEDVEEEAGADEEEEEGEEEEEDDDEELGDGEQVEVDVGLGDGELEMDTEVQDVPLAVVGDDE